MRDSAKDKGGWNRMAVLEEAVNVMTRAKANGMGVIKEAAKGMTALKEAVISVCVLSMSVIDSIAP